jgi:hypothetical protein
MMLSVTELVQIVANGGGLRIANAGLSQQNLVQLAANAATSKARLTIVVITAMTATEMVQIAANGGGNVVFDLVDRR